MTKTTAPVQSDAANTASAQKELSVTEEVKVSVATKLTDIFGKTVSRDKAWGAVKAVLETVFDKTKEHGRVGLPGGLGSFHLKDIKARQRRIPRTGETFDAPATTKIRYVAGSKVK